MEVIEKMDDIVNTVVQHYRDDWFKVDRQRAEKDTKYVVILRDTGCDTFFLGSQKSFDNLRWAEACLGQEHAEALYYVNDGEIKEISKGEAAQLLKDAWASCPKGYLDMCSKCDRYTPFPSIKEYNDYLVYAEDQRNHFLAVMSYPDWIRGKRGML